MYLADVASLKDFAGIEYAGTHGITYDCRDAIMRLIQYGEQIKKARLLTCGEEHAFLLTLGEAKLLAVKAGFASGHNGTGPTGLSLVLQLLEAHKIDIDEYEVGRGLFTRLEKSALTTSDIRWFNTARAVHPTRYWDYISEVHQKEWEEGTLWRHFPPIIPYGVIDPRIADLAVTFWNNPDHAIFTGYRRLEDTVRARTGLDAHGKELFSKAFRQPNPRLKWKDINPGELQGRIELFTGLYMAHRNPRGHKEPGFQYHARLLDEFFLLNHLFHLEKESNETKSNETNK